MIKKHIELHQFAHDLRNVLSVIHSNAQILELTLAQPGLGKEQKIAEAIGRSARKMDTMIAERIDVLGKAGHSL